MPACSRQASDSPRRAGPPGPVSAPRRRHHARHPRLRGHQATDARRARQSRTGLRRDPERLPAPLRLPHRRPAPRRCPRLHRGTQRHPRPPHRGAHFVHRAHATTLSALRDLIGRFGAGSRLSRIPIPNQEEIREMVISAFTTRACDGLGELAVALQLVNAQLVSLLAQIA